MISYIISIGVSLEKGSYFSTGAPWGRALGSSAVRHPFKSQLNVAKNINELEKVGYQKFVVSEKNIFKIASKYLKLCFAILYTGKKPIVRQLFED